MPDPLTLKVMRVSRPTLASAWQPFFSSSPSFTAHAAESIISLQAPEPLHGHPETLRDLTGISDILSLPAAFGSIVLGETFQSCLCINNETDADILQVTMKVEMQTESSKVVLAEVGGPDQIVSGPGGVLETLVSYEIKSLGQHVLACSITYRPPGNSPSVVDDFPQIRKFYKFAVTNPLSVKTKVHVPRSPSALLSKVEREKVFLEVHMQNLTTEPLWFEQLKFECMEGWRVEDANLIASTADTIFSGSGAMMYPQDMRQYIYILQPKLELLPSFPVVHAPGTVIPLGRLDISWRGTFGGAGRLLTSVLSRRVPVAPAPAVSAVPPHLQRTRPTSPRSSAPTPPLSPFKARVPPSRPISRPQSPAPTIHAPVPRALAAAPLPACTLEWDLTVAHAPSEPVSRGATFDMHFALTLACSAPATRAHRRVTLAVQHVQPTRAVHPSGALSHALASQILAPPAALSRMSTPSPGLARAQPELLAESPVTHWRTEHEAGARMPPPYADEGAKIRDDGVQFIGPSTAMLPPFVFSAPPRPRPLSLELAGPLELASSAEASASLARLECTQDFVLAFVATVAGFAAIGGLRLLLVDDVEVEEPTIVAEAHPAADMRILKEWEKVGEVLVK